MKYAYYTALVVLISLLGLLNLYIRKSKASAVPVVATVPHIGAVQVLNGCGRKGAGTDVEAYLRIQGFDVKETRNAADWNYQETMVIARVKDMSVAAQVAEALHTANLIKLRDEKTMFDVTVFVGQNYPALISQGR